MRSRLVLVSFLALSVLVATTAAAAPGDPRTVQGTLAWPSALGDERFVVVHGDDGADYFVDVTGAQRAAARPISAGDRVAIAGYEGVRPYEVTAVSLATGNVALTAPPPLVPGAAPSALPLAAQAPPTAQAPEAPERPWHRFDGTIDSVRGSTLVLRTKDGKRVSFDISQLVQRALKPGDQITVFGYPQDNGAVIARGFVQGNDSASALPRAAQ